VETISIGWPPALAGLRTTSGAMTVISCDSDGAAAAIGPPRGWAIAAWLNTIAPQNIAAITAAAQTGVRISDVAIRTPSQGCNLGK
jgi:hypothetical protein